MAEEKETVVQESPSIRPPGRRINFKLIALILVVFLTLVSISLAVYLVKQRQEIRKRVKTSEAVVNEPCGKTSAGPPTENYSSGTYTFGAPIKNKTNSPITVKIKWETYHCWQGRGDDQSGEHCFQNGQGWHEDYRLAADETKHISQKSIQEGRKDCGSFQIDLRISAVDNDNSCNTNNLPLWGLWLTKKDCVTPTLRLTPILTPTSVYELECKILKAYDENWNQITDFSTVSVGDTVRFLVEGLCDEPQEITDARFRINGGEWLEPTGQKEGHFYFEYEILTADSYQVEAMVYNPALGWR